MLKDPGCCSGKEEEGGKAWECGNGGGGGGRPPESPPAYGTGIEDKDGVWPGSKL